MKGRYYRTGPVLPCVRYYRADPVLLGYLGQTSVPKLANFWNGAVLPDASGTTGCIKFDGAGSIEKPLKFAIQIVLICFIWSSYEESDEG